MSDLDRMVILAVGLIALFAAAWTFYLAASIDRLRSKVRLLERDAHPPIDLTPAMVDVLKTLKMVCPHPPENWYCTRGVGHDGPCAAHRIETL